MRPSTNQATLRLADADVVSDNHELEFVNLIRMSGKVGFFSQSKVQYVAGVVSVRREDQSRRWFILTNLTIISVLAALSVRSRILSELKRRTLWHCRRVLFLVSLG